MSFKGITQEYRLSDEFKEWSKLIKQDYPDMPAYLVELAILRHKMDPKAYQQEYKQMKQRASDLKKDVESMASRTVEGAVQVFESEDELPKCEPVKTVEY